MKLMAALSFLIVTFAFSVSAFAGCNITVKFVNQTNKTVTINKDTAKVRIKLPTGTILPPPPWKKFMTANVTVKKRKTVTKAYTLAMDCSAVRKFKVKIKSGSNSWWENKVLATMVDKTLKLKIKP